MVDGIPVVLFIVVVGGACCLFQPPIPSAACIGSGDTAQGMLMTGP